MFERPHHQRIALVLAALDGARLRSYGCLFGGGTCIALRFGEFRESVDIDFLVSDPAGYRELRQRLTSSGGLKELLQSDSAHSASFGELRADQYGLRTKVLVEGATIKFEIVREARIELDLPAPDDQICGVSTLSLCDLAASKMLANSDRYADDSVYSRDLIDLAMMNARFTLLHAARIKAEQAYGGAVIRDLARAMDRMQQRPGWLDRCMQTMAIEGSSAWVWQRIRRLRQLME